MSAAARLHRQRDRLLCRCAEMREAAYRIQDREPDRAECLRHDARQALADARAIDNALDTLAALGEIHITDERQMALGGIA